MTPFLGRRPPSTNLVFFLTRFFFFFFFTSLVRASLLPGTATRSLCRARTFVASQDHPARDESVEDLSKCTSPNKRFPEPLVFGTTGRKHCERVCVCALSLSHRYICISFFSFSLTHTASSVLSLDIVRPSVNSQVALQAVGCED